MINVKLLSKTTVDWILQIYNKFITDKYIKLSQIGFTNEMHIEHITTVKKKTLKNIRKILS